MNTSNNFCINFCTYMYILIHSSRYKLSYEKVLPKCIAHYKKICIRIFYRISVLNMYGNKHKIVFFLLIQQLFTDLLIIRFNLVYHIVSTIYLYALLHIKI